MFLDLARAILARASTSLMLTKIQNTTIQYAICIAVFASLLRCSVLCSVCCRITCRITSPGIYFARLGRFTRLTRRHFAQAAATALLLLLLGCFRSTCCVYYQPRCRTRCRWIRRCCRRRIRRRRRPSRCPHQQRRPFVVSAVSGGMLCRERRLRWGSSQASRRWSWYSNPSSRLVLKNMVWLSLRPCMRVVSLPMFRPRYRGGSAVVVAIFTTVLRTNDDASYIVLKY